MSTYFEQYRQIRREKEEVQQASMFAKANEILLMYRRNINHQPSKDTAADLQGFFDLQEKGWTGYKICEMIEKYAQRLNGKQGITPPEFCYKLKQKSL